MELNMKERKTYEVIKKVIDGEITRKEAMEQLQRSRQQIYRFIKKFYTEGEQGFVHKSRGKVSSNKKDDNIIKKLETLYLNEYYDYNLEAFYEEIESKYDISYSLMVSEFKKDDIISPLAHKETIKLYNEKMNKAINDEVQMQEEKIELFKSRHISFEKAHTR